MASALRKTACEGVNEAGLGRGESGTAVQLQRSLVSSPGSSGDVLKCGMGQPLALACWMQAAPGSLGQNSNFQPRAVCRERRLCVTRSQPPTSWAKECFGPEGETWAVHRSIHHDNQSVLKYKGDNRKEMNTPRNDGQKTV